MARESSAAKGKKRISLDDDDATSGLFGSGPATIKESLFADYDYGGNAKPTPVWLIIYERDGEEYEQPYSVGKGWKVSKDGLTLEPKANQNGLPESSNAIMYLVKPLKRALKKAGIDVGDHLSDGDPSELDGMEVVLERVDQEERVIKGQKARDPEKGPRSILTIVSVESAPWEKGSKKKRKAVEEDDEEEAPKSKRRATAADDDDDEAPAKSKRKAADDDDDDEKPARGKKKPAADDDDDDEAPAKTKGKSKSDPIAEAGIEAIIEVASEPVAYDDLEKLLKKELKGNDDAAEIIEWCMDTDNLEKELGWTWNAKKEIISAE